MAANADTAIASEAAHSSPSQPRPMCSQTPATPIKSVTTVTHLQRRDRATVLRVALHNIHKHSPTSVNTFLPVQWVLHRADAATIGAPIQRVHPQRVPDRRGRGQNSSKNHLPLPSREWRRRPSVSVAPLSLVASATDKTQES